MAVASSRSSRMQWAALRLSMPLAV